MTDGIASRFNTVAYDAGDDRSLDSMLLHPSTALLARPGRRPGPGLEVTVGGTPEAATVAAGGGVITESAVGGSYRFVIPTPVALTLPARPSAGTSRIDYVLVRILNEDARPGDTLREPDVYLLSGTAGASPTPPTIPTGHLRLARLDVPASGTIAVSQPPPRIAATGGIIVVTDSTERDAIAQIYDGLEVYREDTDTFEGRVNGAWATLYEDTGWTTLSLLNGWSAVSGYSTPKYRRRNGVTHLKGVIKNTTGNVTIGTLAAGFRPIERHVFGVASSNVAGTIIPARCDVLVDGTIAYQAGGYTIFYTLDGISFFAEA